MSGLLQDLRYAVRMLAKSPGFTAVAVLSLALGIGANTAIFSLVDVLLLDTLQVREPRQLALFGSNQGSGVSTGNSRDTNLFSLPLFERFREENRVFSDVFVFSSNTLRVLEDTQGAYSPRVHLVSGGFFSVLGVDAVLGRVITPDDNRLPGGHSVLVISHNYWKRRFGQNPDVVGTSLTLNDTVYKVIGVAPRGFYGLNVGWDIDGWIPVMMQAQVMRRDAWLHDHDTRWLRMMGRLRPGATFDQAAASSTRLLHRIFVKERGAGIAPDKRRELERVVIEVLPGGQGLSYLRERYSQPLLLLMSVVALILLIACANVANLLLARASARTQEIGVRLSLGAGRARMVRQLLTESLVLASLGGGAGFLCAVWGRQVLLALVFGDRPAIPLDLEIDARVLAFTACVALLTGVLFGLAPALRAAVLAVAPNMPIRRVATLAARIDGSLRQEKLLTKLTGFFGILALSLAAIGLYGIMAYSVSRRTREIGLRMALGEQRQDVVRAVLRETLLLVVLGAALGIPLTLACGRFVAGLLFGLTPADPMTMATAVLVLLATGVLAASLPARRATRIDPMTALRYE